MSGIYAGDPGRLSTRHAFPKLWEFERSKGSLIRGMMAARKHRRAKGQVHGKIISFRDGLDTLVRSLASKLPEGTVRLRTLVRGLRRDAAGRWLLRLEEAAAPREQSFDRVVLALPAQALARLECGEDRACPLASLSTVEQPSVSSLFLGYRREQVSHPLDGFGGLIPALEKRPLLGVLFSSSLFEGRAPAGHVALTVMVGGTRQSELARKPLPELMAVVKPQLEELLGVKGEPVFLRHRCWPAAIPQYNLGYETVLGTLESFEKANPGLYIGGNVRDGIAVPNCILGGLRMAHRVCTPCVS